MTKSLTAAAATTAFFFVSFLPGRAAGAKLWYPDYATSYESGRCTDQPSSSLLKLASYASSGYEDQATCCQESFPGQMRTSYCSCIGGCSEDNSAEDMALNVNFDVDAVFEKLMNETGAFERYQAEQERYWSSVTPLLTSYFS